MERHLHLQQLCEESFAKESHSSALRRALLCQVRRQPGPFELHCMVMYKRKMAKHQMHHTWHGPARVIGKDIHGYWLLHRGMPILAHANNLRRAVESGVHCQRGILDLTKEIPDNTFELVDDEGFTVRMIEDKADGWQIRAEHCPAFLKTNPANLSVPTLIQAEL